MAEVRVIARAVATPGKEAQLAKVLRAMLKPTHAETGEKVYDLYESDTKGRFYFFEIWASQQALDVHASTPHFKQLEEHLEGLLAEPMEINILTQQHP
ncbi:MAG: antibiotic biosynthesis monooxygenase [Phycisphaerae bacterium]|nr:antibiotic biosynthesis monooxygenase [Phycisphaerae bacterium]